ncbi:endo alpha-1,4 polygalactosaminidase [Mycolicibacterium canariasense]|nr:endo alpha-1,4 polygalactosaminidase [Mycolicibacterium canariasense]
MTLLATACLALAGCSTDGQAAPGAPSATSTLRLPDRNAGFDYQLGGPYRPPAEVGTVERDRTHEPAGVGYDICYVNGFQTQPAESADVAQRHPDLVVQLGGKPLVDPDWPDEYLLDTSTAPKREALAAIVKPWIDGCAAKGYAAVEVDNLDSYTRSAGRLTVEDNVAMAATYARMAHQSGLAIAQKNGAEIAGRLRSAGYDFAITESCAQFSECDSYTTQYPVVLDIEYTDELGPEAFDSACNGVGRPPVMIMRDHNLVTPNDSGYYYSACAPAHPS